MADAIDVCSIASAPVIADHTYMARNPNILRPAPTSTRTITLDRATGLLVAEMSNLNGFDRVYQDACDEGLTLISHITGREVVYAVNGVVKDAEGDLVHWDLIPADTRDSGLPALRIFND